MRTLLLLLGILTSTAAFSQFNLHTTKEGVEVYTRWGHEKWWSKKSDKVLLVKIKNVNLTAVEVSLGVELFHNMQLLENSPEEAYCISKQSTAFPRMRGLVFKPSSTDALKEMDSFELTGLEVRKLEGTSCTKE
jgi:hypothetical protein